jgi:branched-chain amino acid transport system permease protein
MRPAGIYDTSYAKDLAIVRTRLQWILLAAFLALLISLPLFMGRNWIGTFSLTGIVLIAVLGLHITTGLCGQINLGQTSFMAVGAYTSAALTAKVGLPFLLALPIAGIMAGMVGLIFGAPSLKIKGFYLAMSTLAAQFILVWIILHTNSLGGAIGMNVPYASIGGFSFDSDTKMYYLIIALVLIAGLAALNLTRTRTGRAFTAIRDNDLAAEVMGINLFYYKLLAFFIGCLYAGIAGSLWAHYFSYIQPLQFTLKNSAWYLGMIIVGGAGSTLGAVLGTVSINLLDTKFAPFVSGVLTQYLPLVRSNVTYATGTILFALVILIFLIKQPRGLAHWWQIIKTSYRLWPYGY